MTRAKWWQVCLIAGAVLSLTFTAACAEKVTVKDDDTVRVDYTLTLDDGTEIDTSIGGTPLEFTLGTNAVIPGFEAAVKGMEVGQTKTVKLTPAEGYGERDETLVQIYERSMMPEGLEPEIGMQLQAQRGSGGMVVVTIIAFDENTVTVDANSELAGKNLNFEITLVEIVAK